MTAWSACCRCSANGRRRSTSVPPNLPPRSPALLLATARDTIRPPAKALTVPNRNLPDSQEPFPVFKNLALPPLELSVPS
jgi:hypothetical protein